MRGEFVRGDGLTIPNNVTYAGKEMLLWGALRNTVPTLHVGLITGAPTLTLISSEILEPAIGTNGYARQIIARDGVDWPNASRVGNEAMIESKLFTFAATGAGFSRPIQRLALFNTLAYVGVNPVLAISAALPNEITITPATDLTLRQFRYRIYL